MAVGEYIEQIAIEAKEAETTRQWHTQMEDLKHKHDERMAEMKLVEANKLRAKTRRADAVERLLLALLKLLPVTLLVLAIPVLLLAKREVPQFVVDFISL